MPVVFLRAVFDGHPVRRRDIPARFGRLAKDDVWESRGIYAPNRKKVGTGDGRHTGYLWEPERWRHLDCDLFDTLKGLVEEDRRSVDYVECMIATAHGANWRLTSEEGWD